MALEQSYRQVEETTVCQKTTVVTSHKVENDQHHSLKDKVKEVAGRVFHHHNQVNETACIKNSTATCEKKEGLVDKMKHQLKSIGKKKHRGTNCECGSDSSSDESDDEK
ncbi:unnamed protein product [Cuscuta campestris]|uniref:Uncharacterized protein n=1 Tax=Cuscuta campestris TaxID=132261 RepID=A0A484MRU5_9ASTE|nr:unnamed protein product [Cuscuta campestris]VFQ90748.1 unnamed protein product [Cuscuta campestris]